MCSLPLAAVAVGKLISLQCRIISKGTSVLFCYKETHVFPSALYSWLCSFSLLLYMERADNPKRLKMCRRWRQVKNLLLKTRALIEHRIPEVFAGVHFPLLYDKHLEDVYLHYPCTDTLVNVIFCNFCPVNTSLRH